MHEEQLQRFEQFRNTVHPGETEPTQECVRTGVGPGDGRGVSEVRGPSPLRAAGLHDYNRHRPFAGLARERLEPRHRVEPFDVQSDRAHPLVVEQGRGEARNPELRLVAGGDEVGDGQPPPLHRQADPDVRRLGHDSDAALPRTEPPPPVLVGPQRCAVEKVDESVAVRPDDRHLRRRLDQGALQRSAVARFEKARGVADGPAGAGASERGDHLDGCVPVDGHEGGVRYTRKLGDGSERGVSRYRGVLRVHRPQRTIETHPVALLGDPRRLAPTDDRDAPRAHEAGEPCGIGHSGAGRGTLAGRHANRPPHHHALGVHRPRCTVEAHPIALLGDPRRHGPPNTEMLHGRTSQAGQAAADTPAPDGEPWPDITRAGTPTTNTEPVENITQATAPARNREPRPNIALRRRAGAADRAR